MDDIDIVHRIGQLAEEEHALERSHTGEPLSADELERMQAIEVALDQCWDLLRQRRARREVGENPNDASARDERIVEGYQQ